MSIAMAQSLSLREIKERISILMPKPYSEDIFSRANNTYKQMKKAKKLLQNNPKQTKKLESLLASIETLLSS